MILTLPKVLVKVQVTHSELQLDIADSCEYTNKHSWAKPNQIHFVPDLW